MLNRLLVFATKYLKVFAKNKNRAVATRTHKTTCRLEVRSARRRVGVLAADTRE